MGKLSFLRFEMTGQVVSNLRIHLFALKLEELQELQNFRLGLLSWANFPAGVQHIDVQNRFFER